MNLETLVLELVADDSKLSRDIDAAVNKATKKLASLESAGGIAPKVNFKELHDLNKLLDVKQRHIKQTVKVFNDNPITVRVNTAEVAQAKSEIAALRGELKGMSTKVKAEVTHRFEGQKANNDRVVNAIQQNTNQGKKIESSVNKSAKSMAGAVLRGNLLSSAIKNTFGVIGKGAKSVVDDMISERFGSSELLGKKLTQAIAKSLGSDFNLLAKDIELMSRKLGISSVVDKMKEEFKDLSDALSDSIDELLGDDRIFEKGKRAKSKQQKQQQLERRGREGALINARNKFFEQEDAKQNVSSQQQSINTLQSQAQVATSFLSNIDFSGLSKEEIDQLNSDIEIAESFLSSYTEQLDELQSNLQLAEALLEQKQKEFKSAFNDLKKITPKAVNPVLYQAAATTFGEVDESKLPKITRGTKNGDLGTYSAFTNAIELRNDMYEQFMSGEYSDDLMRVLLHELRHAKQSGQGSFEGFRNKLNDGGQPMVEMARPQTVEEAQQINEFLKPYIDGGASQYTLDNEVDAELTARRNFQNIAKSRNVEVNRTNAIAYFGMTGEKIGNKLGRGKIKGQVAKIEMLQKLMDSLGMDSSEALTKYKQLFEKYGKDIEDLQSIATDIAIGKSEADANAIAELVAKKVDNFSQGLAAFNQAESQFTDAIKKEQKRQKAMSPYTSALDNLTGKLDKNFNENNITGLREIRKQAKAGMKALKLDESLDIEDKSYLMEQYKAILKQAKIDKNLAVKTSDLSVTDAIKDPWGTAITTMEKSALAVSDKAVELVHAFVDPIVETSNNVMQLAAQVASDPTKTLTSAGSAIVKAGNQGIRSVAPAISNAYGVASGIENAALSILPYGHLAKKGLQVGAVTMGLPMAAASIPALAPLAGLLGTAGHLGGAAAGGLAASQMGGIASIPMIGGQVAGLLGGAASGLGTVVAEMGAAAIAVNAVSVGAKALVGTALEPQTKQQLKSLRPAQDEVKKATAKKASKLIERAQNLDAYLPTLPESQRKLIGEYLPKAASIEQANKGDFIPQSVALPGLKQLKPADFKQLDAITQSNVKSDWENQYQAAQKVLFEFMGKMRGTIDPLDRMKGDIASLSSAFKAQVKRLEKQGKQLGFDVSKHKMDESAFKGVTLDADAVAMPDMSKLKRDAEDVGRTIPEGLNLGVNQNKEIVFETIDNAMGQTIDIAKKAIDSNSPSQRFIEIGQSIGQGLGIGANESLTKAEAKIMQKLKALSDNPTNLFSKNAGQSLNADTLKAVRQRVVSSSNNQIANNENLKLLSLVGRTNYNNLIRMHPGDAGHLVGDKVNFVNPKSFTGDLASVLSGVGLNEGSVNLQKGDSIYRIKNPGKGFDIPYAAIGLDNDPDYDYKKEQESLIAGNYKVTGVTQQTIFVDTKDSVEALTVSIYELEEATDRVFTKLSKKMQSASTNAITDGLKLGTQQSSSQAGMAMVELAEIQQDAYDKTMGIESPSKWAMERMRFIAEGFRNGAKSFKSWVMGDGEDMAESFISGFYNEFDGFDPFEDTDVTGFDPSVIEADRRAHFERLRQRDMARVAQLPELPPLQDEERIKHYYNLLSGDVESNPDYQTPEIENKIKLAQEKMAEVADRINVNLEVASQAISDMGYNEIQNLINEQSESVNKIRQQQSHILADNNLTDEIKIELFDDLEDNINRINQSIESRIDEILLSGNNNTGNGNELFGNIRNQFPIIDDVIGKFSQLTATIKKFGMLAVGGLGLAVMAKGLFDVGRGALEAYRNIEGVFIASKLLPGSEIYIKNLRQQAIQLGSDLQSTLEQGIQFSAALVGTPLEAMSQQMFQDASTALSYMGLQQQQYDSALLALKQVASKGRVSLEEITGQLGEAVPGIMPIVADALGTNVQGAIQQIESGNVLAEDLLPKLVAGMRNRTAGLAPAYERSLTAAQGRLGTSMQELNVGIGERLAPAVIPAINVISEVIIGLGKNINALAEAFKLLAVGLTGNVLVALGGLATEFIRYNGLSIKAAFNTKALAGAFNVLKLAAKPLLIAFAAIAAFEVITFTFKQKGDQQVLDSIKSLDNALKLLDPETERDPKFLKNYITTGNVILDLIDNIRRKIDALPTLSDLFGEEPPRWAKFLLQGPLALTPTFGEQQFEGEIDAFQKQIDRAKRLNDASSKILNDDERNRYFQQLDAIDQEMAAIKGRIQALRITDAQGNADQIKQLETQLYGTRNKKGVLEGGLSQQRRLLETDFDAAGIDTRRRILDDLKRSRDFYNDKIGSLNPATMQTEIAGYQKRVEELTVEIDRLEESTGKLDDGLKQLGNTLNAQRLSYINLSAAIAQTNQNYTDGINQNRIALNQLQMEQGIQTQVSQFQDLNFAVYEAEQQIKMLQETLKANRDYLNSDVIDTNTRAQLETLTGGKKLDQLTVQEFENLKLQIEANANNKALVNEQMMGAIESVTLANSRILEAKTGLSEAQKALAEFEITKDDYYRDTARQVADFNQEMKMAGIQNQRSVEDFNLQIQNTSLQLERSNRGLIEAYRNLETDLNIQLETAKKSLLDASNKIKITELRIDALSLTPGNNNSAARQVTDFVDRFTESLFNLDSDERQIKIDILNLEKERIGRLEQIRSFEEQQFDAMREYEQTVRDLTRSRIDTQNSLSESTNNLTRKFNELGLAIERGDSTTPAGQALRSGLQTPPNASQTLQGASRPTALPNVGASRQTSGFGQATVMSLAQQYGLKPSAGAGNRFGSVRTWGNLGSNHRSGNAVDFGDREQHNPANPAKAAQQFNALVNELISSGLYVNVEELIWNGTGSPLGDYNATGGKGPFKMIKNGKIVPLTNTGTAAGHRDHLHIAETTKGGVLYNQLNPANLYPKGTKSNTKNNLQSSLNFGIPERIELGRVTGPIETIFNELKGVFDKPTEEYKENLQNLGKPKDQRPDPVPAPPLAPIPNPPTSGQYPGNSNNLPTINPNNATVAPLLKPDPKTFPTTNPNDFKVPNIPSSKETMDEIFKEFNRPEITLPAIDWSQFPAPPIQNTSGLKQTALDLTNIGKTMTELTSQGVSLEKQLAYVQLYDDIVGFRKQLEQTLLQEQRGNEDRNLAIEQLIQNSKGYLTIQEKAAQAGMAVYMDYENQLRSITDKETELNNRLEKKGEVKLALELARTRAKEQGLLVDEKQYNQEMESIMATLNNIELEKDKLATQREQLEANQAIAAAQAESRDLLQSQLNLLDKLTGQAAAISSAQYSLGGTLVDEGAILQAKMQLDTVEERARLEAEANNITGEAQDQFVANAKKLAELDYKKSFKDAIPFVKELGADLKEAVLQTGDFNKVLVNLLNTMASTIFDQLVLNPFTTFVSNMVGNAFGLGQNNTKTTVTGGGSGIGSFLNLAGSFIMPAISTFGGFGASNAASAVVSSGGYTGNTVQLPAFTSAASGLDQALMTETRRTGQQSMLAVINRGESVLSTLNGDAQKYQALKRSGKWDALSFADGTERQYNKVRRYSGRWDNLTPRSNDNRSQTINKFNQNYTIVTPNADSFRKSQSQIQDEGARTYRRKMR